VIRLQLVSLGHSGAVVHAGLGQARERPVGILNGVALTCRDQVQLNIVDQSISMCR
jgi:hypothetical protein